MVSDRRRSAPRATARGVIAAMAMSGFRNVTTRLGLVLETPPEAVLRAGTPGLLMRLAPERRAVAIELAHWAYGAAGGAVFAALPERLRRKATAGPAYGVLTWLVFEAGIAPLLGLPQAHERRVVERAVLLADHVLYGVVVAGNR